MRAGVAGHAHAVDCQCNYQQDNVEQAVTADGGDGQQADGRAGEGHRVEGLSQGGLTKVATAEETIAEEARRGGHHCLTEVGQGRVDAVLVWRESELKV